MSASSSEQFVEYWIGIWDDVNFELEIAVWHLPKRSIHTSVWRHSAEIKEEYQSWIVGRIE